MRFVFIIGLIFLTGNISAIEFVGSIKNLINTGTNITKGIVQKIPDAIPTPKAIFETGKQVVAGYPLNVLSTAVNEICTTANSVDAIKSQITPDIKNMALLLMTPCNNYSFPLLETKDIWNSPAFDKNKKVVILVTGWTTNINGDGGTIDAISKAYFCRGDVNFIALDADIYVDTLYTWSALNTEEIGLHLATALVELSKIVSPKNIHLIGHSLGAHIIGSAGRNFYYKTNKLIGRLTGLDPAKPCFKEGESLAGLQRGYSDFLDVIHSNCGVLGKREPTGDIDFYPGGLDPIQSGCFVPVCSHSRAWLYYAETVYPGNENNFMGVRCNSLTSLHKNNCPGSEVPMGYATPSDVKGNYFLDVNEHSPFGKNGKQVITGEQQKCGLCV